MSFDVLQDKIRAMKNPTVAGLDARIEYVPEHIRRAAFEEHGVGLKPNLPRASVRVTEELYPEIKEKAKVFFTLGSYVAFRLTGRNATHITDAAASGFFNAVTARPDSCGLKLPEAVLDVEQIGTYEGKRIFSPVGDQQAAILGSGAKRGTYILNLGTAAQDRKSVV